jgi:hypothetical protein
MSIMNSFINDLFEKTAGEASKLSRYNKKPTITSRVIQTAVRLLLPGDLAKHAVSGRAGGDQVHLRLSDRLQQRPMGQQPRCYLTPPSIGDSDRQPAEPGYSKVVDRAG